MKKSKFNTLAVIPARGGSKGIPRKNIRLLKDKPLILYSIESALNSNYIDHVVVTTDDEEIAYFVKKSGVEVIMRPPALSTDEVTLDAVIYHAISIIEKRGINVDIVVTIQPTSPLLSSSTIDRAINKLKNSSIETIISVYNDPHLSWKNTDGKYIPNYSERINRQLLPNNFIETGGILASKRYVITPTNRIGKDVSLLELNEKEAIDIDSITDWWVAEKMLDRKKVVIRVNGYKNIGLGHVYRMLLLADNIIDHDLIFLINTDDELAQKLIQSRNYKLRTYFKDPVQVINEIKPDIVINDVLNTTKKYISALKKSGYRVINFEDLGPGARYADAVINALYQSPVNLPNFYLGEKYFMARNEFIKTPKKVVNKKVENVLLTFGGVDPNNLTLKTLNAIKNSKLDFTITIILGPGFEHKQILEQEINQINKKITILKDVKNMADHMHKADIIFSSAGRSMYEIAMVGTPTIIIAQNSRELTHTFGHIYNGFHNLGLHSEINQQDITVAFHKLYKDYFFRKELNDLLLQHDLTNGIKRVYSIIFNNFKEDNYEINY